MRVVSWLNPILYSLLIVVDSFNQCLVHLALLSEVSSSKKLPCVPIYIYPIYIRSAMT